MEQFIKINDDVYNVKTIEAVTGNNVVLKDQTRIKIAPDDVESIKRKLVNNPFVQAIERLTTALQNVYEIIRARVH